MLDSGNVQKLGNSDFELIYQYLYRKHSLEAVISDILNTFWMKILLHRMQKEVSLQLSVIHLLHKFSVLLISYIIH